jgi:hypothetical protein
MPTSVARVGANLPNGNFLPEIWSRKLNVKYYKALTLMKIANTNWEGEIKGQGSKVQIRQRPTITVGDYTVNSNINYQALQDDKIELLIDKAKYWAFKVDDIDKAQADINIMNESSQDAAVQAKIAVETQVFGSVYADATSTLSTLTMDKTNILDWIIDAEVKLDENNVPTDNRFVVITPKAAGYIQKSDLKNASITGDDKSVMRSGMWNGRLGEIAGFTVYVSNCLASSGTTYQCFAGQKDAITFASQITKVETLRLQDTFGDAMRGLAVYGFKVVKPEGLVSMPAVIA